MRERERERNQIKRPTAWSGGGAQSARGAPPLFGCLGRVSDFRIARAQQVAAAGISSLKICAYHMTPPIFHCPSTALGVRKKENV